MSKTVLSLKVLQADILTPELLRLTLQTPEDFQHQAGDYLLLGLTENDLKPFSIASAPNNSAEKNTLEVHIRQTERNQWMEDIFKVAAGTKVCVKGPEKQMRLQPETKLNIFVAGGTGIAPMKALLEKRLAEGVSQKHQLYWGARKVTELYINQQLVDMAESSAAAKLNYIPVVSEESWQGREGLVHLAVLQDFPDLTQATVYICGHWDMIQTAKEDFVKAGLDPQNFIH